MQLELDMGAKPWSSMGKTFYWSNVYCELSVGPKHRKAQPITHSFAFLEMSEGNVIRSSFISGAAQAVMAELELLRI